MAHGVILGQKTSTDDLLPRDGTRAMTGNLNMGNNIITNLSNGVNDTDAATVGQISTLIGDNFLSTNGGIVNGKIDLNNTGLIINQMYTTSRLNVYNYSAATTAVQYNVLGFGCPVNITFSHLASNSYTGDSFFMGGILYTNKTKASSSANRAKNGRVSSRDYEILNRFANQLSSSVTSPLDHLCFLGTGSNYIIFNRSASGEWTADCSWYDGVSSSDAKRGGYMALSFLGNIPDPVS